MAEETATFALRIDADTDAPAEAAKQLEVYRSAIVKSQQALADYRKSQSLLKGSSDEVRDAKAKLRAAIDLERGKIAQSNLGILKLGGSFDKLTRAERKNRDATDSSRKAIASVGGPVHALAERLDGVKEILPALASGWGLFAAATAIGVTAIALAGAAVAGLVVKFSEWLATTADANRNLRLTREAFAGNTKNAEAWGHVMDWASERTALTTAQLNELVVSTEKTFRGFRLSGQGMVDAFKATSMAAGAGRQDVSDFFKELIERGKASGRTAITFPDLARFRNAGIDIKQIYKELGVDAAKGARGAIVSTDKMAAALAKISDSRFAEINAKKMLSLGAQWDRFKDNLQRFTADLAGEGGALEPLLGAIKQVADLFDASTESGQALKAAVTAYGTAISNAIVAHIPDIKAFVLEAIKVTGTFIDAAGAAVRFAQSSAGLFAMKAVLVAIAVALTAVAIALVPIVVQAAILAAPFLAMAAAVAAVVSVVYELTKVDWSYLGTAIVDGIKNGLTAAFGGLQSAVAAMGEGVKSTFKRVLGIASPSKAFTGYGVNSGESYGGGIERAKPEVRRAAADMAETATSAVAATNARGADAPAVAVSSPATPAQGNFAARGAPAQAGAVDQSRTVTVGTIENHFHLAGANAAAVKAELASDSFLESFAASVRELLQSQGMQTGVAAVSGG